MKSKIRFVARMPKYQQETFLLLEALFCRIHKDISTIPAIASRKHEWQLVMSAELNKRSKRGVLASITIEIVETSKGEKE